MLGNAIIPVSFLAITALLLWYIIDTRGKWWVKLVLIVMVPAFCFTIWTSLDSYLGWPSGNKLPEKALLVWAVIEEPNKDDPGAIYLWISPYESVNEREGPFAYSPRPNEPRVYKVPYSRKLHEMLIEVGEDLSQGVPVVIEFGRQGGVESTENGEEGSTPEGYEGVQLYPLPPPSSPPKQR